MAKGFNLIDVMLIFPKLSIFILAREKFSIKSSIKTEGFMSSGGTSVSF